VRREPKCEACCSNDLSGLRLVISAIRLALTILDAAYAILPDSFDIAFLRCTLPERLVCRQGVNRDYNSRRERKRLLLNSYDAEQEVWGFESGLERKADYLLRPPPPRIPPPIDPPKFWVRC
jgi:hypothetical protein